MARKRDYFYFYTYREDFNYNSLMYMVFRLPLGSTGDENIEYVYSFHYEDECREYVAEKNGLKR